MHQLTENEVPKAIEGLILMLQEHTRAQQPRPRFHGKSDIFSV
jgi:hypothetical protein